MFSGVDTLGLVVVTGFGSALSSSCLNKKKVIAVPSNANTDDIIVSDIGLRLLPIITPVTNPKHINPRPIVRTLAFNALTFARYLTSKKIKIKMDQATSRYFK